MWACRSAAGRERLIWRRAAVAHAGPGDGPGGETPDTAPPDVHASENPVFFQPFQTTKTITLTWKPEPKAVVKLFFTEDGASLMIATERAEIATPVPQPPHIDPTFIPKRPDLN